MRRPTIAKALLTVAFATAPSMALAQRRNQQRQQPQQQTPAPEQGGDGGGGMTCLLYTSDAAHQ